MFNQIKQNLESYHGDWASQYFGTIPDNHFERGSCRINNVLVQCQSDWQNLNE
jgi:hypothetical protein